MNHYGRKIVLINGCVVAFSCVSVFGFTGIINFDTDTEGLYVDFGSPQWRATGGNPDSGGFFSLTDAQPNQRGAFSFQGV